MSDAPKSTDTLLTVAVCTYNRAYLLRDTLESLTRLDLPSSIRWQLLIIDNNCTDGTSALCASYEGRLPIRVLREPAAGVSNARNCALRAAVGTYLLFIDDDVRVHADWLVEFLAAAGRHPEAVAFGGPIEPDFPAPPDPDYVAAFPALGEGFCGLDHGRPEGALPAELAIWTANTAYRRSAVEGLGFDPRLGSSPTTQRTGEEEVFLHQLRARGGDIVWVPAMRVKHYVDPMRMRLKYLISFQIGKGEQYVYQNNWRPEAGRTIMGVPPWMVTRTLKAYGRYAASRWTRPRADALKNLSKYCFYRGMLKAVRAERAAEGAAGFWRKRPAEGGGANAALARSGRL